MLDDEQMKFVQCVDVASHLIPSGNRTVHNLMTMAREIYNAGRQ